MVLHKKLEYHALFFTVVFGYLTDLDVTVSEVKRHDLLVDLLLPKHHLVVPKAAVHKAGVLGVESVQMQRRLRENVCKKQGTVRNRQIYSCICTSLSRV